MPKMPEVRKQISVALTIEQRGWVRGQARKRGVSDAEFVRRLIDGMMLGDNTMSRGVDWQPQTLPPPATLHSAENMPRGKSPLGEIYRGVSGILVEEGFDNYVPTPQETPTSRHHPMHQEYIDALRTGDFQKAAKIWNGTVRVDDRGKSPK